MFAFLSALAPSAVASAVANVGAGAVLASTARIVAGAVITKVGADIARPAVERIVAGASGLVLRRYPTPGSPARGPGSAPNPRSPMTTDPLPQVHTIVTHGGPDAHTDELLAVAVLLATFPDASVHRRDPTPEELLDPEVAVVDVGGVYDPARMNFDHHQFAPDRPPVCSLTLVLDRLGVLEAAHRAFPWLERVEVQDARGPVAAARLVGTGVDQYLKTLSPVETFVLRRFGQYGSVHPGWAFHELLVALGREKLDYVTKFAARQELLTAKAAVRVFDAGPGRRLEVVDVSFIDRADDPKLGLEAWIKARHPDAAVVVSQDDRGDGLTVFRRNDHPLIDFSVLAGTVGCVFAHKNGFVAKLAPGVNPLVAIRQSLKVPPP